MSKNQVISNLDAAFVVDANNLPIALTALDGGNLSNITASNASYSANANYANIAGEAYSVAVANVVGIGNIATINLDGNVANVLLGDGTWGQAASPATEQPIIQFTANAIGGNGQSFTDANLASFTSTDQAMVFVNGVLQRDTDYSLSGNTLTITGYLASNDLISVQSLSGFAGNGGGGGSAGTSWTSTAAIAVGDIFAGGTINNKTPGATFTPSSNVSAIVNQADMSIINIAAADINPTSNVILTTGAIANGFATVFKSVDYGVNWVRQTVTMTTSMTDITYGSSNTWVTVGPSSQMGVSLDDGTTWANSNVSTGLTLLVSGYSNVENLWAVTATGGANTIFVSSGSNPLTSTWTTVLSAAGQSIRAISYCPSINLVVAAGSNNLYTAPSMAGPYTLATTMPSAGYAIASSPTSVIVVGTSGMIMRSTDGITWTQSVHYPTTFVGQQLQAATYNAAAGMYIVSGQIGTVLYSLDDGLTWIKAASPPALSSVAVFNTSDNEFVVLGSASVLGNGRIVTDTIYTEDNVSVPNGTYRCLGSTGGYNTYYRMYGGLWTRTA